MSGFPGATQGSPAGGAESGLCVAGAFSCVKQLRAERWRLLGARGLPACIPGPDAFSAPFTKAPAAGLSCAHHSGFKAAPKVEGQSEKIKTWLPKGDAGSAGAAPARFTARVSTAGLQTRDGVDSRPRAQRDRSVQGLACREELGRQLM